MNKITDFELKGKRVLVRCDFNIPLKGKRPKGDLRIKRTLPTINFLIKNKAKTILISHLGDPAGKIIESLRLDPVAKILEKLLKKKIVKSKEVIGKETEKKAFNLKEGEVLLLENVRFHPGEEKKDENFIKELARLGEIYINEAFSVSHRDHASVSGLPKKLPAAIGFEFEEELKNLENFLKNYERPLVILMGGKKIEDKAPLLRKFLEIGDWILVNHLMSLEIEKLKILDKKILKPIDGQDSSDIGPKTIKLFKEKIKIAKTIFWNGPFGKIEENFVEGTRALAIQISKSKAFSLVGGGETIEILNQLGLVSKFSFVSLGGGAMLKFLAGEKLPGLVALNYYGD